MTHPPMGGPAPDAAAGPTSDPRSADQPSEAELRAYLDQLRDADAGALVAEAYNLLADGAQVKLGRNDARTLIDAMAAITQVAAPTLPAELAQQMQQGVQQLQLAQVQAEAQAKPGGQEGGDAGAATDEGTAQEASAQRMTDRLWVPGRDPGPGPRPR